jgi:hypothetical protein
MADVLGSGLPHADALNTWREDGTLALEPLDWKWSLETASARQVSEETLARLLATELPSLSAALAEARAAVGLDQAQLAPRDADASLRPDHPANRAACAPNPLLHSCCGRSKALQPSPAASRARSCGAGSVDGQLSVGRQALLPPRRRLRARSVA